MSLAYAVTDAQTRVMRSQIHHAQRALAVGNVGSLPSKKHDLTLREELQKNVNEWLGND